MAGGYGAASSPDSNAKVVGMLKNLHGDIVQALKADPNAEHTIVSVSTQVVSGSLSESLRVGRANRCWH
jgi:hypothetical protein